MCDTSFVLILSQVKHHPIYHSRCSYVLMILSQFAKRWFSQFIIALGLSGQEVSDSAAISQVWLPAFRRYTKSTCGSEWTPEATIVSSLSAGLCVKKCTKNSSVLTASDHDGRSLRHNIRSLYYVRSCLACFPRTAVAPITRGKSLRLANVSACQPTVSWDTHPVNSRPIRITR